jgi:hypothetical protein
MSCTSKLGQGQLPVNVHPQAVPYEDRPWSLVHTPATKLKTTWPNITREEVCSCMITHEIALKAMYRFTVIATKRLWLCKAATHAN